MIVRDNVCCYYGFRDVFSNHHIAPFTIGGQTFNCVEQWMMYQKAMYFGDRYTASKIMAVNYPVAQMRLGREIQGFNREAWLLSAKNIVFPGMLEKYRQNEQAQKVLLSSAEYRLAEASPTNLIWGIGLHICDPNAYNPENWLGQNWAGELTERVRTHLREDA